MDAQLILIVSVSSIRATVPARFSGAQPFESQIDLMNWFTSFITNYSSAFLMGVLGALLFEAVTILFRFGFGWTSPERTRRLAVMTRGWRIHHGYPGVLMITAGAIMAGFLNHDSNHILVSDAFIGLMIVVGLTLALSDLIHHAIVLQLLVGNHEFDLRYPDP